MDAAHREKIKQSLNHVHKWPSVYMFKFIVVTVSEQFEQLTKVFPDTSDVITRPSKNGKYTSVTIREVMLNADDVFAKYEEVSKIEGVMSL